MKWLARIGWMVLGAVVWTVVAVSLYLLPFIVGG